MKTQIRKATMTNKERVEALLRREKPDRVPHRTGGQSFAMLYSGGSIADRYTKPAKAVYLADKKACRDFDWVFFPTLVSPYTRREFGGEVKLPTGKYSQAVFVVKHAADTPEEAMALKMPDVKKTLGINPEFMAFYEWSCQDKDDNKPFNISIGCLSPTSAADIVGTEKLCKWMLQEPEVAHHLLRLTADYQLAIAKFVKETFGTGGVLPSGAAPWVSNQLISPKHFEQFALPYQREVHQKVLAMGFKHLSMHICGEHNLNLPYWQQVPMGNPGIISIGDEVKLSTAAKYFPNDIIEGNLNTAVIQTGTPDEVYEAARKVIEEGKSLASGFMLRPACELPPLAPVENMRAITRALNDFGWYD